ncbi:MAG: exosortase/archaeosortase family protein [Chloroflexota bacterium]|nr:exosortase/archaeosortase family protein [Chloroflexota bacterium]
MKHEESERIITRQGWSTLLMPIVIVAVLALLTWPVWRWLWGEWMGNSYYSHGILIGPVALYLGWQRFQLDKTWPGWMAKGDSRGLLLLAISLGLYLYFVYNKAYYLAAFAMIGLLLGLIWVFGGLAVVRKLAFPLGYLLLMVPLPFIERSTLPLALFTGVCSGALVQFLGLDITVVGNAITLPNANLVVGAQCSGVNSIIALTSLNTLAAYLLLGPLWGRLALVALAIPIAVAGNIVRVANLLFVARYYGAEAAFLFYHDYSGIVFFVLVLLLLIPLTRLLRCDTLRLDVI